MGEVERLDEYFNSGFKSNHSDSMCEHEINRDFDAVNQVIKKEWSAYKRSRLILHGERVQDNSLDMILLYLLKRGVIGRE